MKRIYVSDTTLTAPTGRYSFKEKIETARCLEKLGIDAIELGEIRDEKTDSLLVKSMGSFVKNSIISVAAGGDEASVAKACSVLGGVSRPRIRLEFSLSVPGMEYIHQKKAPAMLEWVVKAVSLAKANVADVELCVLDATRADRAFLKNACAEAVKAGATLVTLCDTATVMLPDDFASFVRDITEGLSCEVGVRLEEAGGLACASAVMALRDCASWVKTSVGGAAASLSSFAVMMHNTGIHYGLGCELKFTDLSRSISQIEWISESSETASAVMNAPVSSAQEEMRLDAKDTLSSVKEAVKSLGYDLSEEDMLRVYEEFQRVSSRKDVGAKELEAIIASCALQVPETYRLENYVINNGNMMSSSAQIALSRDGEILQGLALAGGPIDAAFLAIEEILGHHYELDDFQIQAVTEGKEAMGSAMVKLRYEGRIYPGNGISTDIIGASIRAYLSALNKIVYEEE